MKTYIPPKLSYAASKAAVPAVAVAGPAVVGLAEAAAAAASAVGFFAGTRLVRALRGGSPDEAREQSLSVVLE